MTSKPNPGSDEAVALGCECSRMDNSYGKGHYGQPGVFVYTANCPVHDPDGDILRQIKEWQQAQEASDAYWESNTSPDPEAESDA